MLAFTINLTERQAPAIASGFLVLVAIIVGCGGIARTLSYIWYGFRRILKGAILNFKTLFVVHSICAAGLISGTYLPMWIGRPPFPAYYVVGLSLPLAVTMIATMVISLEDGIELRQWRSNYVSKSKYIREKKWDSSGF